LIYHGLTIAIQLRPNVVVKKSDSTASNHPAIGRETLRNPVLHRDIHRQLW
jgi:hypothetical protein